MTQEFLKENVYYDRTTGLFYRIKDRYGNKCNINICTSKDSTGYYQFRLFDNGISKKYKAHRLAWLYEYGYIPKYIDHINHNRIDNRIENLREIVSKSENSKNRSKMKNNTTGTTGVHWLKKNSKWVANIRIDKKLKHLGSFELKEDAILARLKAEKEYGFHSNHGR